MAHTAQSLGKNGGFAHKEHLAGIAVVAVFDDGDVDIDDIAVFEFFVAGNAVADLVIDRGADGLGVTVVIQGCGNRLLHVEGIVVADLIQLVGGDTCLNMGGNHS